MAGGVADQAPFGIDDGPVYAVSFSPDGAIVASAGAEGDVLLRDARTAAELGRLVSDNEAVWSMAFSPDGDALAIGDEDGSVRLWDLREREERSPLAEDIGLVLSVSFAPDGAVLAAGTEDGTLRLLNAGSESEPAQVGSGGDVLSAAFSGDGALLAAGDVDGLIRMWDTRTGDPRHSFVGHAGEVQTVAVSPDGVLLVGGGAGGSMWLWDVRTGSELGSLRADVGTIQSVAFSPDGTLLAVAGSAGSVCLCDIPAGQQLGALLASHDGPVYTVAFSPDGTMLATGGGHDGTVRLWDVRTGEQHGWPRRIAVSALAFSHDGSVLAGVGADGSVRLWEAPVMGRHVQPADQDRPVTSVAFSLDDTLLAGGGADGSLTLWDVRTGERRERFTSYIHPVTSVAFGPDGTALALSAQDGIARVWDERGLRFTEDLGPVESAAFSPDGMALAIGRSDGTALLMAVPPSPATHGGYDLNARLEGHIGPVRSVAFSPGGDVVATGDDDGTVQLWEVTSRNRRAVLTRHDGPVRAVAFGRDGSELASGGEDGRVRVWDVRTGEPRCTLAGHIGPVRAVAFSPDSWILASGGDDAVRIWDPRAEFEIRAFGFVDLSGNPIAEKALADATRAVERDPGNPETLAARADVLRDMGRLEEALADAQVAMAHDPDNSVPLITARVLRDMGQFDSALDLVNQVIGAEPSNVQAQLDLARILYAMGEHDQALAQASKTAERSGDPEAELLTTVLTGEIRRAQSISEQPDVSQPAIRPLADVIPFPLRALLGGGYNADAADDPHREDALGFDDDVRMLCSVLADQTAQPPLSVGLFGEWGSGKSFFMRLMRQRIARLAEVAREAEAAERETRYCSHVVQITFNAWHYMDANLWASLAAEIFFRLAAPDTDAVTEEKTQVERQRQAILQRLDTCQQLAAELTETRQHAETQRRQIEEQLDQAQRERQDKLGELAAAVAMDVAKQLATDPDLAELREKTAQDLGLSALAPLELPGLVGDLRKLSGLAGATWRLLVKRKGGWAWAFGLAAVFLISLLVGLVLLTARGGQWHGWVAIGVTVASLTGFTARIRPVLTAVGDGLDMAEKALQREEALVQQFRAQQTAERVRLEAELERLTAQEQNLTVQLAAAAAAEAQARSEERDLRADRRLRRFLEERSGSSDYQGQLGLISLLHKDFRRLDTLLRLARESADSDLPRIDRIILYIDDLDRCPPARVVEVLQAIHLLLALPLFVVVVGVDPRWLLGSLQRHYHALLQPQAPGQTADDMSHWASTPQDYLEKIFQIPFALMPMTSRGFAQLISDLAGEPAAPPTAAGHDQPSALRDRPAADGAEPTVSAASSATSEGTDRSEAIQAGLQEAGHSRATHQPPSSAQASGHSPPPHQDLAVQPGQADTDGLSSVLPPDAEEQRILVREGSVASSGSDGIDPNPVGLRLTDPEIGFIQALAPMVTTPRVSTRLVNVYRMIRSTQPTGGPSRFLDLSTGAGDYQAILILLAIVSGFPDLAASTFEALLQADADLTWPAFVDGLLAKESERGDLSAAQSGDWVRMGKALAAVQDSAQVPDGLSAYREWAPRVARFSFAAGHLLSSSAAS